jgi:hypothetical protein
MSVNNSLKNLMELDFEPIRRDKYFGFYDWFCDDSLLKDKSEKLIDKLKSILEVNNKIDIDKTYVFFKNNCPCVGTLYDDFRICNLENGDVLFTVKVCNPNDNNLSSVWSYENYFHKPVIRGYWSDIIDYFKKPSDINKKFAVMSVDISSTSNFESTLIQITHTKQYALDIAYEYIKQKCLESEKQYGMKMVIDDTGLCAKSMYGLYGIKMTIQEIDMDIINI